MSTTLLPLPTKERNKCLHFSFFGLDKLRILGTSDSDILASAETLGLNSALSGYRLPYSGLFRIYWFYGGNGLHCYGVTVTLNKR